MIHKNSRLKLLEYSLFLRAFTMGISRDRLECVSSVTLYLLIFFIGREWLPVKPREPPVEIQPVDTKPSKLSKWSKFTKFCKGSRGSKVICECPSIDDPIPEPNETIYEKIMNLVNYIK